MRVPLIVTEPAPGNVERRWQGWADLPLSADGVAQAEAVAAALRGLDVRIEEADALLRRAVPALLAIARREPPDGVAVAVSHGGLIRCVRLALGGTDRPVPGLAGCWLDARDHGLRLVADADIGRDSS